MPESPAAQARVMKQWENWYGKLGAAVADPGLPFSGAVNKVNSDRTTAKGPIGKRATGYTILEAKDLAAATKMAKGCPLLKSEGSIAVYETASMM
jgi:hypothetical protein